MARWAAFAGVTVLSLLLFLALARASQATMQGDAIAHGDSADADPPDAVTDDPSPVYGPAASDPDDDTSPRETETETERDDHAVSSPVESMSTGTLLVNVALSQGIFGALVLFGAWYARIPLSALGVSALPELGTIVAGVGLGVSLYAGNELAALVAEALGFSPPDDLRTVLAPDSVGGWALLLVGILPAIAFVEELVFRAAFIGAFSVGFSISPWPLAVVSSIAFALGHGAQGSLGMVVTGALGFVLATAFVLTGSLVVVVLAHSLVNTLEFVVHEGLEIEFGAS